MATNAIEEFRGGVTACLRSWSALRTAVESGWGGGERESQTKADDLRNSILDIMDGSQNPIPHFEREDLAGA
jgi:pre-rRNA-processing protein TSR2